jgi:hypothetical protein
MADVSKITVPWNAAWTGEARYEVRPCRWVGGRLAMWCPHAPRVGKPVFARPHMVRQRRSIAEMLCTVCGEPTVEGDRWWFGLGRFQEGWFMTTEAPVHHVCAKHALTLCPHLRGHEADLEPMPTGFKVLSAIVGGPATENDFGVQLGDRKIIGSLKLAWPASRIRRRPDHG